MGTEDKIPAKAGGNPRFPQTPILITLGLSTPTPTRMATKALERLKPQVKCISGRAMSLTRAIGAARRAEPVGGLHCSVLHVGERPESNDVQLQQSERLI